MKELVLRLFRIPSEPDPPPGAPGSLRTFRAARRFYHYEILTWILAQFGGLAGLLFGVSIVRAIPAENTLHTILVGVEIFAWITYILAVPLTFYLVRLDYEMRWYMVTDRSLRIREGIIRVKEKTMTFANIQNLSVRQGPIQRFLRIEDLEVQTAGGGGSQSKQTKEGGEAMHVAKFRGVDNAEEIRELIRQGMRRHLGTGLGDPDEQRKPPAGADDAISAARQLFDEARALRSVVSR